MSAKVERDYSGRTLFEKLGVETQAHVALVGCHEESFAIGLNARLSKAASITLRTRYDLIFVRIDEGRDLVRIGRAAGYLKSSGALWVFHPKGRGADPNEHDVRAAGIAAGLVDNKISAYTESHTATRFVIPVAKRLSP